MDKKEVDQPNIKNVHSLLFGDNNEYITQVVKKEARNIVSEVISEAIYDRQKKDQSLTKTIAPLLENTIEQSINNNKANLVTSLYPVVGSLVRKSVSVFFNSFLEKLNNLIEYSLTIKGVKWRFAAWRQGIPFTQYIIKQSFVYRVENVMLIHRETGTLLIDVASEQSECNDPTLMSAMLTAINDFMADSFKHNEDVVLDIIKTKELTLMIASGPKAILVAAVSGLPPVELQQHLQQTLEEIHEFQLEDLLNYTGDNTNFAHAEPYLRGCLLSAFNTNNHNKKQPKWGIAMVFSLCLLMVYQLFGYWQQQQLLTQVTNLAVPKGLFLQKAHWQDNKLALTVFRDPVATPINHWLKSVDIPLASIKINELAFVSLEKEIIFAKVAAVLEGFNVNYLLNSQSKVVISGNIDTPLPLETLNKVLAIPGLNAIDTQSLIIENNNTSDALTQQYLLDQYIAKLALQSIEFNVKSAKLSAHSQAQLLAIAQQISRIEQLALSLKVSIGIIISGYSDISGNSQQNQKLSLNRANNVKQKLIDNNVPEALLHSLGAGEVSFTQLGSATRKVMFTVIKTSNQPEEKFSDD